MSIKANTTQLQSKASQANTITGHIKDISKQVNNINSSLDWEVKGRNNIGSSISGIQQRLEKVNRDLYNISRFLTYASEQYNSAEASVIAKGSGIGAVLSNGAADNGGFGAGKGSYDGISSGDDIGVGAVQGSGESIVQDGKNKNSVDSILDTLQTALDVVGFIPGLGDAMDGINVAISILRGDLVGAALSAIGLIPVIGSALAVPLKTLLRTAGNTDEIASALKVLANIFGGMDNIVDGLKAVMNSIMDIIKNIPDQIAGLADNGLIKRLLGDNGVEALGAMVAGLKSKVDDIASQCDEITETVEKAVKGEVGSMKTVEDILEDAKPGRTTKGRAIQYEKPGGFDQALEDFNSMDLTDVRDIPGGKVGKLPDGRTVNVRNKSSDGRSTLEIFDGKGSTKIRYDN